MKKYFFLMLCLLINFSIFAQKSNEKKVNGGKTMDAPVQRDEPKKDEQKDDKKDDKNPFADLIENNHDQNVKAFKEGKIFLMTGLTAQKKDSSALEGFVYKDKKELSEKQLIQIAKILSDTASFKKRNYEILGAFAPNVGFEFTNIQGKKEVFMIAFDLAELEENAKKDEKNKVFSQKSLTAFKNLQDSLFAVPPVKMSVGKKERPKKAEKTQPQKKANPISLSKGTKEATENKQKTKKN